MGPSRLLQTDTCGCFDLLIRDWARMKPPYQSEMKNRISRLRSGKRKCFSGASLGLLHGDGLLGLLLVSITGSWRYKALEIVYALVYQEDKLVLASTEHPSFGVRRRMKWWNTYFASFSIIVNRSLSAPCEYVLFFHHRASYHLCHAL